MNKCMSVFACLCISIGILPRIATAQHNHMSYSIIVIDGVTIVDVERGTLRSNCAVTVSSDRIQRISNETPAGAPGDSTLIVDGKGMFLIPGLIDAHAHYIDQATFGPMMIANGVLFVRDMGSPTNEVIALRSRLNSKETPR